MSSELVKEAEDLLGRFAIAMPIDQARRLVEIVKEVDGKVQNEQRMLHAWYAGMALSGMMTSASNLTSLTNGLMVDSRRKLFDKVADMAHEVAAAMVRREPK